MKSVVLNVALLLPASRHTSLLLHKPHFSFPSIPTFPYRWQTVMRLLSFLITIAKSGTRTSCTEITLPGWMLFSIIHCSHSQIIWSYLIHKCNIKDKCWLLFGDNFPSFWSDKEEFHFRASAIHRTNDPLNSNSDTPVIDLRLSVSFNSWKKYPSVHKNLFPCISLSLWGIMPFTPVLWR